MLALPVLPFFSTFDKHTLEDYSKVFLSGLLRVDNFDDFNNFVQFDGYYINENILYLFFDVSKCKYDVDKIYTAQFALIDEITNHKAVCNVKICDETTMFFTNNESINYLYDKHNEVIEIPVVGYVGKTTLEKLNFTYVFGETSKNKLAIFGAHFYFTDFNNSIKNKSYGVVRFALFAGKTKYIENDQNLPIDESEIKQQRLNDLNLNRNYEIQTLRISDHDGNWTKMYDSIYLGKLELDDGTFIEDTPMIVVKSYEQQIPLSCHFV